MLMQTETDGFTRRSINKANANGKFYNDQSNSNNFIRPNEQRVVGTHHLPKINHASVEK